MNEMFEDMLGQGVTVYIDDVNIYTKTWKEHIILLR